MTRVQRFTISAALVTAVLALAVLTGSAQLGGPGAAVTITPAPAVFVNGTSAVPTLLPNGSAALPASAFTAEASTGMYHRSANTLTFSVLGGNFLDLNNANGYMEIPSSTNIAWSTTADATAARDLVLRRSAAKTLTVDTDGAGGALTLVNLVTGTFQQNGRMVPTLAATGRQVAQTGAVGTLATLTPAADGSFQITGNVTITAFTAAAIRLQLNYTSEDNIARALNVPLWNANAWGITAGAADVFVGGPITIRAKAATAITLSTAGTFTTVTYNAEGFITQVSN